MHLSICWNRYLYVSLGFTIAVVAAILLSIGINGGFFFDDHSNIVNNTALNVSDSSSLKDVIRAAYSFEAGGGSRSLAMLTFAFDSWRSDMNPAAFKATNIIIHCLTCLVLCLFVRQLLLLSGCSVKRSEISALAITAVWAIHPLQVSSVLYVVQRMQTLATLFTLLALFLYLRMRNAQMKDLHCQRYGILAALSALLAFASKEDAALIPLYLLVLEITILKFRGSNGLDLEGMRRIYYFLTFIGILIYLFVVIPYFWSWENYSGRDFNSVERLLTQARVLTVYLQQILFPWPDWMTFFYDHISVSRSLLNPPSTFFSIVLILIVLVSAWCLRIVQPVFSFGFLFFFAGHFMTSNVISLDLAYEHRNHLPMVGVFLAVGDILSTVVRRYGWFCRSSLFFLCIVLCVEGLATARRAHYWGDDLRLAEYHKRIALESERAWLSLCTAHFERHGINKDGKHLALAIDVCQEGANRLSRSAILVSNLVTYKAINGTVSSSDWKLLEKRLRDAPMNIQNQGILWATLLNAERGLFSEKDENGVLQTINIIASRIEIPPESLLRIAVFIFNETYQTEMALPYLKRAASQIPKEDPLMELIISRLSEAGKDDWVELLRNVNQKSVRGST
ncbi:hypothetical protein [Gilvimarinus algae]|uniref:DUF1736 domain-containing protein n=1 Tax=Gilvimarinus algae TaxID=3058037 RepID=A0ABT8TH37_9GAMM|nr:hypothetical protein [Gilvimarinus sp. SDUM040014]MDO3382824.1 hypothetical protein [Gilvimarinus sp. SDUM040014]